MHILRKKSQCISRLRKGRCLYDIKSKHLTNWLLTITSIEHIWSRFSHNQPKYSNEVLIYSIYTCFETKSEITSYCLTIKELFQIIHSVYSLYFISKYSECLSARGTRYVYEVSVVRSGVENNLCHLRAGRRPWKLPAKETNTAIQPPTWAIVRRELQCQICPNGYKLRPSWTETSTWQTNFKFMMDVWPLFEQRYEMTVLPSFEKCMQLQMSHSFQFPHHLINVLLQSYTSTINIKSIKRMSKISSALREHWNTTGERGNSFVSNSCQLFFQSHRC